MEQNRMNHLQMGENLDSHCILDAYNTRIQQYHPPQYMLVEEIRDHIINNHLSDTFEMDTRLYQPHIDNVYGPDHLFRASGFFPGVHNLATLSEEMIINQMKTKFYSLSTNPANLEEADSCVICQDEFKDKEEIGILECRHQYHSHCLKTWLLVKNVCPMCKSEAIHLK